MMWVICENIRGFSSSRPPLVLFVLCLGGFAIVLLTLAYLVKVRDLTNPDEKDWNTFMDGFRNLEFCMVSEDTEVNATRPHISQQGIKEVVGSLHNKLQGDSTETTSPVTSDPNRIISISVPVWADVKPTSEFVNNPHNVTHLSTTMSGKQIGVTGSHASTEFGVTMSLPFSWSKSVCPDNRPCSSVKILTCVNLQAPAKFFPQTRIPDPYGCQMANSSGGVENYFHMVSKPKASGSQRFQVICQQNPSFTLNHNTEQGLNIMLSLHDRSAINLHLMHTSYFLFVMVVMMMCYALVRGKPGSSSKPIQYTEVSHA